MALIRFDSRTLNIDIIVGIEEHYKPSKEAKVLNKRISVLRQKTLEFLKSNYGSTDLKQIAKELAQNKEWTNSWDQFMTKEYIPEVNIISNLVTELNKKVCPNYSDFSKSE